MSGPERRFGFSLLEVLVSVAILSLVFTALLAVYAFGIRLFTRTDQRSELIRNAQLAVTTLQHDLMDSSFASLEIDGSTLAFLAPSPASLDSSGRATWKSYLIYSLEERTLRRRVVEIPAGAPQVESPGPISGFDPGSGPQELSAYLTSVPQSRVMARELDQFIVYPDEQSQSVKVELLFSRQGSQLTIPVSVRLHND
ncbi:MAG: type II secretion system protein J [Vulcanimicrobiota bacterium]